MSDANTIRRPRFSLRSVFVVTIVVAIFSAALAWRSGLLLILIVALSPAALSALCLGRWKPVAAIVFQTISWLTYLPTLLFLCTWTGNALHMMYSRTPIIVPLGPLEWSFVVLVLCLLAVLTQNRTPALRFYLQFVISFVWGAFWRLIIWALAALI